MSKASRKRRARDRLDVRLDEGRAREYDLLMWQFPEWNLTRLKMLDKWEKSRETLYQTPEQEAHFIFYYEQIIHKGRKP